MTDERVRSAFLPAITSGQRLKLGLGLLIAVVAVSTASILIRFAQADGAPSLVIAALRLVFATAILSPVALTRYRDEFRNLTRIELLLGMLAGIFLAAHFATWISSLEFTTVASSVVFVSTGPLWVALLSPVFLKEHLARAAIIGLLLSLAGGTIIGLSDVCTIGNGIQCPALENILQGRAVWGNFLALAGAWAVSGYLMVGRRVRSNMSLIPYIFMVYGIAAIVLVLLLFASGIAVMGYPPRAYLWIMLLTLIPQLIGHSMFNWLLKYLSATMVAVTTLAEPVGSASLAFLLLGETPRPAVLVGGVLILTGIYLTATQNKG